MAKMANFRILNKHPWFKLSVFLLACVFVNLITSHIVSIFAHLKQPLKPDTFYNTSFLTISSAIIIAPFVEELAFRGFLSVKRAYLASLPLLFFFVLYAFHFNRHLIIVVSFLSVFFVVLAFKEEYFNFIYLRYTNYLILFSCFLFCLTHVIVLEKYFDFNFALIVAIPIFFPLSYLLAIVRIRHGLRYSILAHSAHNIMILALNTLIYP